MEQFPIFLAGHRIDIILPQEADLIALFQLVHRGGIGAEFAVIQLNGAFVLLPAVYGFHFFFPLNFFTNLGRGQGHGNENHYKQKKKSQQQVSLLPIVLTGWSLAILWMVDQKKLSL